MVLGEFNYGSCHTNFPLSYMQLQWNIVIFSKPVTLHNNLGVI